MERRRFTREFKLEAVRLIRDRGVSYAQPFPSLVTAVTDEVVPHFHNEPGVPVIVIGAKKFMCIGALPPQDPPHVFCDMGDDSEYCVPLLVDALSPQPRVSAQRSASGGGVELHYLG